MWVSALSLNKKQSSTYNKYACGCFLYAPSIYPHLFKRLTERTSSTALPVQRSTSMYFAEHKFARQTCFCLIRAASVPLLNVSERTGMSVVPYISDVFALQKLAASKCARMYICWQGICIVYFKRLTESMFSDMPLLRKNYSSTYHSRHGCRWHYAVTSLPGKLAAQEYTRMYILGRGCPWFHAAASFS